MNKKVLLIAIIAGVVLLSLVVGIFAGTAMTEKMVVGTWAGEWEYNGADIKVVFILDEDGSYIKGTSRNGEITSLELGDWEVSLFKLRLYDSSAATHHGKYMEYTRLFGALVNNGHRHTRVEE